MTISLKDFRSDLSELGLELVETDFERRWCIRPVQPCPSGRKQAAGFRTLAEAEQWWRKMTADFAFRQLTYDHMHMFLASAPTKALDDALAWLDWLRGWLRMFPTSPGPEPSPGFPPELRKAIHILHYMDSWPTLHPFRLVESGRGWRRRAIAAWRASQRDNGWSCGPFVSTWRWIHRSIAEEGARRLGALPAAPAPVSGRARL